MKHKTIPVSFVMRMTREEIDRLDRVAEDICASRSAAVRYLTRVGLHALDAQRARGGGQGEGGQP